MFTKVAQKQKALRIIILIQQFYDLEEEIHIIFNSSVCVLCNNFKVTVGIPKLRLL